MQSSPVLAILASLVLLDSTTLPDGTTVRRSSLLGYQVAGEVLDLEEAAARVERLGETPKPPRPGLVRLEPAPPVAGVHLRGWGPTTVHSADEPVSPRVAAAVARLGWRQEAPAVDTPPEDNGVTYSATREPAAERVLELDAAEAALFPDDPAPASVRPAAGSDVDDEPPADVLDAGEIEPDPSAVARVCEACGGGQRHRRGGCVRCDGRLVRVWVANREITPFARTRTPEEALGVVCALSGIFAELDDRQRQGALTFFGLVTAKASPALRAQALAQWKLGARNEAFEALMAGASSEEQERVAARWGAAARGT